MSRYIDADALKQNLKENYTFYGFVDLLNDFYVAVDEMPSIDIVRCKECKWAKANGTYQWCGRLDSTARITADGFCLYEKREDE